MIVLDLIGGSLHNCDNESSGLVGRPLCQVTSLKTSKKPPPAVISTDYDRKLAFWKPQKPLGDVTSSSNSWKKLDFVPFGNQHLTLTTVLVEGAESHCWYTKLQTCLTVTHLIHNEGEIFETYILKPLVLGTPFYGTTLNKIKPYTSVIFVMYVMLI